jgi:molybdenum cofactor biosynthesis enzyme
LYEALTAVQVALRTIDDMCKAADRGTVMAGAKPFKSQKAIFKLLSKRG